MQSSNAKLIEQTIHNSVHLLSLEAWRRGSLPFIFKLTVLEIESPTSLLAAQVYWPSSPRPTLQMTRLPFPTISMSSLLAPLPVTVKVLCCRPGKQMSTSFEQTHIPELFCIGNFTSQKISNGKYLQRVCIRISVRSFVRAVQIA